MARSTSAQRTQRPFLYGRSSTPQAAQLAKPGVPEQLAQWVAPRARWPHQAPFGQASGAAAPPPEGAPVARFAHRALGPVGTRWLQLPAMSTGQLAARRARYANRPALGHEIARPLPAARQAFRHRALVTAVAQVPVAVPGARRATTLVRPHREHGRWGRRGACAKGPAFFVTASHGFYDLAGNAGAGELAAPATSAHPALGRGGESPAGPATARTAGLGQRRPTPAQLVDELANRGRGAD